MKKILPPFRFKKFSVYHSRSSMRVGVDGVLIGAWAGDAHMSPERILDAGCGCGLIALMLAQRFGNSIVDAIDIDEESVGECLYNFNESPWKNRLNAFCIDVNLMAEQWREKYDLIVSNPPFFNAGVSHPLSSRAVARHDGSLSPLRLVELASLMLKPGGRLALISPAERSEVIISKAEKEGLDISRIMFVRGNKEAPEKRVMLEAVKPVGNEGRDCAHSVSELIIETERGRYTDEYKTLTGDFYLNM
ncbi:MAG: methyltransferase [Muribaculaceae bacterium]|nr:methyltransferase [Muribaculaceae bacterium]